MADSGAPRDAGFAIISRFAAKWIPVCVKKMRQNKRATAASAQSAGIVAES